MSDQNKVLYLPETTANWPWKRQINPYYEEVKAESDSWIRSFKAYSAQAQYANDKGNFALLASLVYPHISREHLRTGCDLMNAFFVIDAYTDVEPEPVVRNMVDQIIDALRNPHKSRPEGEVILAEIIRQFWELAIKTATPASQRHMVESLIDYLESVVEQARDRDDGTFRTIESYLENRRENIGLRSALVPLELDFDFPDEVFYHPVITTLTGYITDLIVFDNDIASYNKEQACGDDRHNIITLAMRQFHLDVQSALDWVAKQHADISAKFLEEVEHVPSWGVEIDSNVQKYLDGLGNWVRGNDCWNFESGRYFGNKGIGYQKTRQVLLLKKVAPPIQDITLRRENVVIPLVEALETRD